MATCTTRSKCVPPDRVIGTRTLLDTTRLRSLLSDRLRIHAHDIRAYVLGLHGDRRFVAFTSATVGGGGGLALAAEEARRLKDVIRQAGHAIATVKGCTNSGIALCVDTIVRDLH